MVFVSNLVEYCWKEYEVGEGLGRIGGGETLGVKMIFPHRLWERVESHLKPRSGSSSPSGRASGFRTRLIWRRLCLSKIADLHLLFGNGTIKEQIHPIKKKIEGGRK